MDKKQCNSCGKPKCSCKNKEFTKAVIEIDNPEQITLIRRVVIPASMGDDTAVPPVVGKYHNVLLYYEANGKSYLYSSDGVPTQLVNGFTNYEEAINLPQINGVTVIGDQTSADLKLADEAVVITIGDNRWACDKTLEQIYDAFNAGTQVILDFGNAGSEGTRAWPVLQLGYNADDHLLLGMVAYAQTHDAEEFTGEGGYGVFTLAEDHTAEVNNIELQRKVIVADDTGLSWDGETLSGVPATDTTIGMVKPGDGLEVDANGTMSISDIEQYAQFFDTVADMKAATNLVNGDYARTGGFYTINDGGGALYKVTDTGTANEMDVIAVGNLYASLITGSTANALQFGAYGDGTHNDTAYLQRCADFAQANNLKLYIPDKAYLTDDVTISDIRVVNIEGRINLTNSSKNIIIQENVNSGKNANVYVNKITTGNLIMKGMNSANITVQNAFKLVLLADSTTGHNFIGYSKFYLGYIRYLEIKDDGSGSKWVNENLFFGGRFLGIEIGGGSSTYNHQNNLFFKPMCENTVINIIKGVQNRIIDARLEGASTSITFGETTYANVVVCNYATYDSASYFPHYQNLSFQSRVTDNSHGKNKVINNENLSEHLVLSLNKFNNPKELTVSGDNLVANGGDVLFETDFVSLPSCDSLLYLVSNNKNIAWRIECYDDSFTKLTTNPSLFINPTTIGYTSAGTYGNASYNRNDYWGLIDSSNTAVKYIKIILYCPFGLGLTNEPYKNIDMYLTHYGKLDNEGYYLSGLGKCLTA